MAVVIDSDRDFDNLSVHSFSNLRTTQHDCFTFVLLYFYFRHCFLVSCFDHFRSPSTTDLFTKYRMKFNLKSRIRKSTHLLRIPDASKQREMKKRKALREKTWLESLGKRKTIGMKVLVDHMITIYRVPFADIEPSNKRQRLQVFMLASKRIMNPTQK